MSERRLRSGSVGSEGQRRGIIRLSSQRSTSLLVDDVDHASTDNHVAPSGVTAGGTGTSRRRALPIPTLQHLAREALLYGLVDGHPVKLSRIVRGEMNADEVVLADPIPMPLSCRSDDDDDDDDDDYEHPMHPIAMPCIPVSTALLYDPSFWSGLISEAARRRLLSDEFLISLCESGIPPAQLELRGGLTDVAVTDRFLVKAPRDIPGQGMAMPQQTFGSASEMLISSLHHLRLSGGSDMAVERLVGANDLETFLHRLSRSAADLESLTIGPSLLQHELSNTWIGSIKGISSFCKGLRSLELHGLAFGGTGRSDSGSSIGGTTAPSSISSLFEALARNCRALEQLSLARSSGIQDRHLQSLLLELRDGTMSCPNLKDLDLSYTDVGPLAFSALCSRQLGYLDEDGADGSKGIRKLCLDGTGVDHSWLKRILASLPRLEDLSIIHCSNLEAGPEIWDILANSSCKETRSHLSQLAVELWFCSDEICHVATASRAVPVDQHYDDDHQIALAAQYDEMNLEDSLPFLPDSTGDGFMSGAPEERGWSCRHCTLINESQAHRCVACNGRRYAYSPAKNEVSVDDSLGDMDDDDDFNRKQAPLYTFPTLERHPLLSFSAILHLVRDENENAITDREASAQAATAISEKIITALPEKLVELRLSLCNGDDGAFLSHGCILNNDLSSSMIQLHGTTLQELELKSIRFDVPQTLHDMCVGFKELRSLKLFGVHEFGITTAEMLRLISTSGDRAAAIAGCPNLEILQICLADDITRISSEYGTGTTSTNGENDDQSDICFRSPYLKRLWLEGCNDIVKLDLVEVPSIERLSLVNCGSLTHLGIGGPGDDGFSTLQRLRIRGTNLSPYSIASLKLPHLAKLVLEAMAHNEDWEIAKMMEFSSESLTELRIKHCRLLGDYQQWCPQSPTGFASVRSLSVLELFRPSESFDVVNFQKLFVSGKLRDLSICEASGLQGDIYGLAIASMSPSKAVSNVLGGGLPKPVDENLLGAVPNRASIGGGAIDESSSLAATEMLGGRAIERILLDFIESSRNGGSDEYGFPPTLNAFQRKLVHEHAEVLNLEHESVRLNTGVKVVRVRRRTATEAADLFLEGREGSTTVGANNVVDTNEAAAVHVTPEQQRRAQVNVESQTVPSNLERALLAAAATPPQVTFAADVEDSSTSEDDDNDSENGDSDASTSSDNESNGSRREATPATPSPPRVRARSRRELRKAKQAAKRGEVYQFKNAGEDDNGLANTSDDEDDGIDDDTNAAFDPLLQQERFARIDPKALRRLIGLAHSLPVDSNGTAVCVRYLRGACPYQHSKNGGQCRYAHFDVKASTAKKFAALMDYVCGAAARPSVGSKGSFRRKSRGSSRSNEEQMLGASYGSNPGSYNSDVGANLMDVHVGSGGEGRTGGRRRRRKGSIGNEEDALTSEDGLSSRGSSPGRSWQGQSLLSGSPRTGSALMRNGGIGGTPRLELKRLVRLDITRCDHLTGASFNAPCLIRLGLRQCTCLTTLDLIAPRLTTLDVSDSFRLEEFPLHDDSLRGLRVANLNGCKALNEAFCSRLVNHCRALRQLYIFGSGASEKASNTKIRTRTKTKAGLAKLTAGRPKLTLISTKMQLKNVQAKREEVGERGGGFVEEAC